MPLIPLIHANGFALFPSSTSALPCFSESQCDALFQFRPQHDMSGDSALLDHNLCKCRCITTW